MKVYLNKYSEDQPRKRHQPNYYGREQSNLSKSRNKPTSFEEATTTPDSSKWRQAIETEMRSLKENDVWELIELPAERKAVGSKWVYKVKTGADGSVAGFLSQKHSEICSKFLGPSVSCLQYWGSQNALEQHRRNCGPQRKLSPLWELSQIMIWPHVGVLEEDSADHFGIYPSTISRIFIT